MKKFILIGITLSILTLLITPVIPAVEYQTVTTNIQEQIQEQQSQFHGLFEHLETFFSKYNTINHLESISSLFSSTSKTILTSIIDTFTSNETDPYIDSLLDLIVVIIVAYVLAKVVSHVFDNVFVFLKSTGSTIFSIISFVIGVLANILSFGVNSIIIIIQLIFQFLLALGELAMYLILGVVSLILTVIVIIIYGIGLGIVGIWKILGSIVGVILDILRVIYESFFPTQTMISS